MRRFRVTVLLVVMVGAFDAVAARGATLVRDRDPVVLLGGDVTSLLGLNPGEVVAFRYAGGWQQIPVQVDERKQVDYNNVYNFSVVPPGFTTEAYADPTTYTGPDPDPTVDADDELAFMARDAADRAGAGAGLPTGVLASPAIEIKITDPLDGGVAYAYLFRSDGSLTPDAGADYVAYTFNLLAGSYIPNYNTPAGPNPEDSAAVSLNYRVHFSDRWIRDQIQVFAGGATGVDVLDRHKNLFGPGVCSRSEDTFSAGEGAFFTNKDGPVRAIRSYMGANSGPLTQREHVFYEQREDVTTLLRVHPIPGVMDLFDYSPDATGMTYYDDLNLAGVTVDGSPDALGVGPLVWEMVTGIQGTLIHALALDTDITPFAYTSYYSDDATPSVTQCTGDGFEYATSGLWVNSAIPNTDPSLGAFNIFVAKRTIYYEPPNQTTATATLRFDQTGTPLTTTVAGYTPRSADLDGDGDVDANDFLTFSNCFNGSLNPPKPGCLNTDADLDADGDVDANDFLTFSNCFNGALNPPGCP